MAIINCVVCGKKISSKAKSCSHCGANFTNEGKVSNLETAQAVTSIKKHNLYQTLSFVSIIIFIIGILVWHFEVDIAAYFNKNYGTKFVFGQQVLKAAHYICALGFVGYIGVRGFIFYKKKK